MKSYPSDTWCTYPFTALVLHNGGSYGPCCSANQAVATGLDDKEVVLEMYNPNERTKIKPYAMSANQAFNSEFMKDIRQQMMEGKKHPACGQCWQQESIGLKSKRQGMNQVYLEPGEGASDGGFEYDIDEMVKNPRLRSLDLKFDNKCNLHCLMCTSGSSDMWVPLDNKIHKYLALQNVTEEDDLDLYMDDAHKYQWSPGEFPETLYEEIKRLVPQLQEIQCTGGEPFINSHFIELLKYIIDTGHASHISLEVTTNGTKFVTEVMELLTHFRHIRMLISADGTGSTYDYIRAPYRYDLLKKRLKTLDEYFTSGKVRGWAEISAVAMAYNLFDFANYPDIISGMEYEHIYVNGNINFSLHNMDNVLHIKWLPDELINEALEYYKSLPDEDTGLTHLALTIKNLEGYIKNNSVDEKTKLYHQRRMKNYTVLTDKVLNRDYHDYLDPRLCEFLDTIDTDVK